LAVQKQTKFDVKKINLFFFLLFFACTSYGQQKGGWLTWNNADNTISISYPKEWNELKLDGGEIVAFTAPKDNPQDKYPDMLVLRAFPDSGEKNIDRLKDFARTTLSPAWNFKITSSQKIVTKDMEYIKSIAEDKGRKVVLVMYTLLKGDKIYFLTLNVEARNYERYKTVGDQAIESLVIKKTWVVK
jgi:hypothetical protein